MRTKLGAFKIIFQRRCALINQGQKLFQIGCALNQDIYGSPLYVFLGKDVPKKYSKFTGEHVCRNAISMKLFCNLTQIALRHKCSPVNKLHIFRTLFYKTSQENCFCKLLINYPNSQLGTKIVFTMLTLAFKTFLLYLCPKIRCLTNLLAKVFSKVFNLKMLSYSLYLIAKISTEFPKTEQCIP